MKSLYKDLEEYSCKICGKKFLRRTKPGKIPKSLKNCRKSGVVTCSHECSLQYTQFLRNHRMNKAKSFKKEVDKILSNASREKAIAVDLDGTLTLQGTFKDFYNTTPNQMVEIYRHIKPNKKMIAWVNEMSIRGWTIYIFTARDDVYQKVTNEWLKAHGVRAHYFLMKKPFYDMIIDDKAVRPEEVIHGTNKISD